MNTLNSLNKFKTITRSAARDMLYTDLVLDAERVCGVAVSCDVLMMMMMGKKVSAANLNGRLVGSLNRNCTYI